MKKIISLVIVFFAVLMSANAADLNVTGDLTLTDITLNMNGTINVWGNLVFDNVTFNNLVGSTINDGINLFNSSNFTIIDSTLNASANAMGISAENNSTLIITDTSSLGGVTWTFKEDSNSTITNLVVPSSDSVTATNNALVSLTDSTISSNSISFNTNSQVTLQSTNITSPSVQATGSAVLTTANSFVDLLAIQGSSTLIASNSTLNMSTIGQLAQTVTLNFTDSFSTITGINSLVWISEIYGNVIMPDLSGTSSTLPNITRYYPVTIKNNALQPVEGVSITVLNASGNDTGFSATTDANGFANVPVNFLDLVSNFTLLATSGQGTVSIPVNLETASNINVPGQLVFPAGTGGGIIEPLPVDVNQIEDFNQLIILTPEQLNEITTDEFTELVEKLDLTVPQVVQVFSKMALAQKEDTFPELGPATNSYGGGSGAPSESQVQIIKLDCVTGDNVCPAFCGRPLDMECPSRCGDGFADENEDVLSCPADVPFDISQIGEYVHQIWFLRILFVGLILSGLLVFTTKKK